MTREAMITQKLQEDLAPVHLEVKNESSMHSVRPGSETHFKVLVVSEAFAGLHAIDRHRRVNAVLRAEFAAGLHALSLRALTPEEWRRDAGPFESPKCLGGSKADA